MRHIEDYWKTLTLSANELFNSGNLQQALLSYKDALYRAEVLNNNVEECLRLQIPFIQVYIISCNNLANTHEEMGQTEETENMLKRAVYYLLHLTGNKELDRDEIQSELKRAAIAYVHFVEKANGGKIKQAHFFQTLKEQLVENKSIQSD